ncbi:MAG: hypothetical protein E6H09_06930 [Bacteroidetes bacterium]|nr:MAG: hypothetical protein E6H09_06930 [Bacteroidota bacterium]
MNDRLPYEEQLASQWHDLPLPDENMAWADMKRRLEEDDDNGIIPIWLRGCSLWGLVAIVLIGIGLWIVRPEKWWNKKAGTEQVSTKGSKENTDNKQKANDTAHLSQKENRGRSTMVTDPSPDSITRADVPSTQTAGQKKNAKYHSHNISITNSTGAKKKKTNATKGINKTKHGIANAKKKGRADDLLATSTQGLTGNKQSTNTNTTKDKPVVNSLDSASTQTTPLTTKDSVAKKQVSDSLSKRDTIAKTNEPKKDSSKRKNISFSVGLGEHQLIPIDGQKLTPYNSEGRTGSLGDYIPSVFARMYKNDKWFLQLEFRYGAPQATKEILYKQDTAGIGGNVFTSSSRLKKTFYHQVPLTFNYFITRDWSLGAGITWNKFVSAISEQEVRRRNIFTSADTLVSKGIVQDKNDTSSVFRKSYFQAAFETQYRWKRLSAGIRYSFGLQPYISFTLLGGSQQQERNRALQVFIRYELWRSKDKARR